MAKNLASESWPFSILPTFYCFGQYISKKNSVSKGKSDILCNFDHQIASFFNQMAIHFSIKTSYLEKIHVRISVNPAIWTIV